MLTPVVVFCGLYFGVPQKAFAPADKPKSPVLPTPTPVAAIVAPKEGQTHAAEVAVSAAGVSAERAPRCSPADPSLGTKIVNQEDVSVLARPGGFPVEGWDGSPLTLDPRFDLQIVENADDWVRVKIMAPAWPPGRTERIGWIERKFLQRVDSADEKQCLFVDFNQWSSVTQSFKNSIREIALRILREDRRCSRISRSGYLGEGQRFFLSCYPTDGGRPYHYWFSVGEPISGMSFGEPSPLPRQTAVASCRKAFNKIVAQRAKIDSRFSKNVELLATSTSTLDGTHHVTFTFSSNRQDPRSEVAYCLAPPRGEPEITMP